MKTTLQILVLAVLAAIAAEPLLAADDTAAQALVDRAIKAMGGNKAIEKSKNTIIDDVGTYYGMGEGLPYKGRYVSVMPDRYRMEILDAFVYVTDGDKAWMSAMGNVTDVDGDALKVAKTDTLVNYAMSLIPLQKRNEAFKLGLAEAETIEGEECSGITIDHENMPTITMYFSPKSGLPKKTNRVVRAAETGFQEAKEDTIFHEYKEFDGVMSASKMTIFRDGKKFVESNPQKVTYPDSIDESEFKKPD